MSSQARIRALLELRLNNWAIGQELSVVWQNISATPANTTYLRAYLIPALRISEDLEGKHRSYIGVFQVSIVTPSHEGPNAGEVIADALDVLFPVNLRLTSVAATTIVAQVMTPMEPADALQDSASWILPVSCRVRSDTI